MSVLFVMPSWAGASELWMQRMMEALGDDLGAIACPAAPRKLWRERVPVVSLSADQGESEKQLIEAVKQRGIDRVLVHYLTWGLRFAEVWRRCDVPVWVHAHGYDVTWDRRRPEQPGEPQFDTGYPARVVALSRRAVIIVNSRCTAAKLRDIGVDPERVEVKYLGVPVPAACPVRPRKGDALNVLYLGRLIDFKGPELTIAAFDRACERGLQGRLVMAGDGPERAACEAARVKSGFAERITMLGEVDEAAGVRLRAEADVFTAHNRLGPVTRQEEAYGVAYVEAMSAGLPVVSGRSGSLAEIVSDGSEGLLFAPGDVEGHAGAMLRLAGDEGMRQRLGRAAWERAGREFSDGGERGALRRILKLGAPLRGSR